MRIGIAGCGIRGRLFAQALLHESGVEVIGMCDPSLSAQKQAALVFPGPVHSSHHELLNQGLDALVVATPDFAHRQVAVDAASAGVHLMVEKPLATSTEDARDIEQAVAKTGVSCLVAFENRWNPHMRKVQAHLAAGALGDLVSVTGVLSNSYYVPTTMLSWANQSSPAWFLMPHLLDLAMWFTNQHPTSVVARGRRGALTARGIDTWDSVHALMELSGGTIANLRTEWVLPKTSPSIVDYRVEVVGTEGVMTVDYGDQGLRLTNSSGYQYLAPLPEEIDGEEQGMAAWMVRSWARALLAGTPLGPDAGYGARITRTIDLVHRSASSSEAELLDSPTLENL
ncbi:MAG: Gfo/Idh/MocA family protein [Propionibacteriaceae bacterium]